MKIGIYYGSTTGNAQTVAESISEAFAADEVVCDTISSASPEDLQGYDLLILGSSTWGDGELQDDWVSFMPNMNSVNLEGKKVALFGVGDQMGWADTFVDSLAILHENVSACGGSVIGKWPAEGYEFVESRAAEDGSFVGLAIDEANQADKTPERVQSWVELLRKEM